MVDVWETREDVDDTVEKIKEKMAPDRDLPANMISDVQSSINQSPQDLVRYFYNRLEEWTPNAVKYFEERI
ncbi:MAG TPA: hypothetical protein VE134_05450 [Methanomicrobiales archaeon]|nr:hypothetical protein [Methanomicrobiales archaeon]